MWVNGLMLFPLPISFPEGIVALRGNWIKDLGGGYMFFLCQITFFFFNLESSIIICNKRHYQYSPKIWLYDIEGN